MSKYENFSQDRSNRFAVNDLIRRNGYQIYQRKKGREPVWVKSGVCFTESEVLLRLDPNELWEAECLQALYWEGLIGF